jgi:pyruvate dehydrogenase E1 component alpha subunit
MHIADSETGNLGANAIVGAGILIAVGAAFASSVLEEGFVAVSFFGEGAVGEGVFHESLNPPRCEPWSCSCARTTTTRSSPEADATGGARHLVARGAVRRWPASASTATTSRPWPTPRRRAVARGRAGEGPTLLELDTYRQSGHFEGDQMRYRTKEEAAERAERDPLPARRRAPRPRGGDGQRSRRRPRRRWPRRSSGPDAQPAAGSRVAVRRRLRRRLG